MLELRDSLIHGQGVFTREPIRRGRIFHTAPMILIRRMELEVFRGSSLKAYLFPAGDSAGFALSVATLLNDAGARANAAHRTCEHARMLELTALRDIAADEEITINYGL